MLQGFLHCLQAVPAGEIYQETDVVNPGAGAVCGHREGEGGGCPHLQVKPGILNQAFPKAMFPKALGSHKLQIKLIFPWKL